MNLTNLRCPCGKHDRSLNMSQAWAFVQIHAPELREFSTGHRVMLRRMLFLGALIHNQLILETPAILEMTEKEYDRHLVALDKEMETFFEEVGSDAEKESV